MKTAFKQCEFYARLKHSLEPCIKFIFRKRDFIYALVLIILFFSFSIPEVKTLKYIQTISGYVPAQKIKLEEIQSNNIQLQKVSNDQLIINMALANGYSNYEANLFLRIAKGESTMNERAVGYASNNKIQYLGLFQIAYPLTWNDANCSGDIFNPVDNINCAFKVQKLQSWHAWEVYTKGTL